MPRPTFTVLARLAATLVMALMANIIEAAPPQQPLELISAAAEEFVKKATRDVTDFEVVVRVGSLDSRLNLARCGTPLQPYAPAGFRASGNTHIGIRCDGPQAWNILIPVAVQTIANTLVTSHPLARGAVLTAADIKTVRRDVSTLAGGYFSQPNEIIGQLTTQPLQMETLLTPSNITPPALVRRGDSVALVAAADGFEVRSEGTAMENGALGATINVKNLSSKRVVEGVVSAPGEVRVKM